jgi:hypothetical protein
MKTNRRVLEEAGRLKTPGLARGQGIHVWVSHLDPRLAADGLDSQQLWREAQRHLVQAGLPVMPAGKVRSQPLYPCLGILVHADLSNSLPPVYIYSLEVFYVQKISLSGSPHRHAMRMTWCREAIGDVRGNGRSFDWSGLYQALGMLVDSFIQETAGDTFRDAPSKVIN